jgi:hypothetical protein
MAGRVVVSLVYIKILVAGKECGFLTPALTLYVTTNAYLGRCSATITPETHDASDAALRATCLIHIIYHDSTEGTQPTECRLSRSLEAKQVHATTFP